MSFESEKNNMKLLTMKNRKGISPLIATLLLIAIAVAASVLTYSWVMSMIGSQSGQAQTQVRIDNVDFSGTDTLVVLVRNTGSISADIESIAVRPNSAGQSLVFENNPGGATAWPALDVGKTGEYTWAQTSPDTDALSQSFVIRVTTKSGFYYEAVFTSPSS